MALSGSFTGTTNNDYIVPKIIWSATQDILGNYSMVTAELRYSRTNSQTTYGEWYGSITINGVKTASTDVDNDGWIDITITKDSNSLAMKTPAIKVPHNSDGSKSITISASGRVSGTTLESTTISKTITLDKIAQKATITAAPNFNDEQNPTITYNNSAGNAVTSLRACISFDGSKDDIAYRSISKTGSSYTFNLTEAERNVLRNGTKDSNSRTVRFYIETTIGSDVYRASVSKTLTIINNKPTLNPTVKDIGSTSITLTGDANNKVIKGYNSMSFTIGAAALKGATIKSQKVTCGNKSSSSASGTLYNVESGDFVFTVTDSRGNTTTKTISKSLINYVYPTVNPKGNMNTNGEINITLSGKCFIGSFGAKTNTVTAILSLVEKDNPEVEVDWGRIPITESSYKITTAFYDLDYRKTYGLYIKIKDTLTGETNATEYPGLFLITALPVYDWSGEDFAHHTKVTLDNGIPLQGKATTGEDINLIYLSASDILQVGGGAYPPSRININTADNSGNVNINGMAFGRNKVLWEGFYYMNGSQSIGLSEAISKQATGVILVFSRYDIEGGEALNEHFSCHFYPKQMIALHNGKGCVFNMNTSSHSYAGSKYLYMYDTYLTGNAINVEVGTGNDGVTYNNNRFVLRYVIGV